MNKFHMHMFRGLVFLIVMTVTLLPALWAGGGRETSSEEPRTLEVFVFSGPIREEFWQHAVDAFVDRYSNVTVELTAIPKVHDQVRPRLAAGDPPDVYFIAGAGRIPVPQLVAEELIIPLDDLLEGQTWDESGSFTSSLASGNVQYLNDRPYGIVLPKHIAGFWYHEPTFQENGWEVPSNFSEFQELSPIIAAAGIAPMVTTGVYTYYFDQHVLRSSVAAEGGPQALLDWKNLEPGFFRSDPFRKVIERYEWVIDNGYLLRGSEGLNHIASQSEWVHGKAAFVPTGTWLEAEMANDFPEGFAEGIRYTPSFFIGEGVSPVVHPLGGATMVVFKGDEEDLGIEFLRALYSTDVIKRMTDLTNILSVVPEANAASTKSPAVASAVAWSERASVVTWPVGGYAAQDVTQDLGAKLQGLMTGQISSQELVESLESVAERVRNAPDNVYFDAYFPQ